MLNALSSYLQNLPHPSASGATGTAAIGELSQASPNEVSSTDGYVPSSRAIMVSAIASDFDVRALDRQDIGNLQLKLQQYGLLNGRDLDAYSLISTQIQDNTAAPIDAVAIMDKAANSFKEQNTPFSERQSIDHLHRLMHNLDSARQLLSAPQAAHA